MIRFMRRPFGGWWTASKRLAQRQRGNVQQLAILGDRAAGHDDSLAAQQFGDPAVRQRSAWILGRDQLTDQGPDRGTRSRSPGIGGDVAAEEIAQLENA